MAPLVKVGDETSRRCQVTEFILIRGAKIPNQVNETGTNAVTARPSHRGTVWDLASANDPLPRRDRRFGKRSSVDTNIQILRLTAKRWDILHGHVSVEHAPARSESIRLAKPWNGWVGTGVHMLAFLA